MSAASNADFDFWALFIFSQTLLWKNERKFQFFVVLYCNIYFFLPPHEHVSDGTTIDIPNLSLAEEEDYGTLLNITVSELESLKE